MEKQLDELISGGLGDAHSLPYSIFVDIDDRYHRYELDFFSIEELVKKFGGCYKVSYNTKQIKKPALKDRILCLYANSTDVLAFNDSVNDGAIIQKQPLSKNLMEQVIETKKEGFVFCLDNMEDDYCLKSLRVYYFLNQYVKNFDCVDDFENQFLMDQRAFRMEELKKYVLGKRIEEMEKMKANTKNVFDFVMDGLYKDAILLKAYYLLKTTKTNLANEKLAQVELDNCFNDFELDLINNAMKNSFDYLKHKISLYISNLKEEIDHDIHYDVMTEENKEISRKDLLEKEKLLRNLNKYVAYIDLDSAQSLTDSYWWKHLEIEGIPSWWYDESGFRVLPALLDQKFYDEDAISGNGEGISFLKSKNYDKVFSKKFYRFVDLRLLNLDDFSSITPDADDQKVLQKQKQVILKTLDQVIEKGRERFSTNESSSKNKSALH